MLSVGVINVLSKQQTANSKQQTVKTEPLFLM
jgi:hypothetical protein